MNTMVHHCESRTYDDYDQDPPESVVSVILFHKLCFLLYLQRLILLNNYVYVCHTYSHVHVLIVGSAYYRQA